MSPISHFSLSPTILQHCTDIAYLLGRLSNIAPSNLAQLPKELSSKDHFLSQVCSSHKDYRLDGGAIIQASEPLERPAASEVNQRLNSLFSWLAESELHPLIAGAIFHFEAAFIQPFAEGNKEKLYHYQTILAASWHPLLQNCKIAATDSYEEIFAHCCENDDSTEFISMLLNDLGKSVKRESRKSALCHELPSHIRKILEHCQGEMLREELQKELGLSDRKSFRSRYLVPAMEAGLLEMTRPDAPRSRFQKYRLTSEGKKQAKRIGSNK